MTPARRDKRWPVACTTSRSTTPVRVPSPVVATSAKMTWPDCSPPSDSPRRSSSSETCRSPTGTSTSSTPSFASARRRPRFDITVATIGVAAQLAPLLQVECGDEHDLVAVDDGAVLVDRDDAVGVAVEREAGIGAELDDRLRGARPGRSTRSRSLMFVPSGAACSTSTARRAPAGSAGAARNAAPLPQSTTTCRPSSRRPSSAADDVRHVLVDAAAQLARDADAGPRGAGRRRDRGQLGELALDLALELVGNLATAGREQLDPVVGVRVVARRDHRRPARRGSRRDARRRASAPRRRARRWRPRRTAPRRARPRPSGPDRRVSRPTTNGLSEPSDARRGAPECRDELGCQLAVRDAANAVGPEAKRHRDRPRAGALPLRVLRRLARLLQPVLAPFLLRARHA